MGWIWLAVVIAFSAILSGSLWRSSPLYYYLGLMLLSVLALGAGYSMIRAQNQPAGYLSAGAVLAVYGGFLYALGQKYYMKEGFLELTTPAEFIEFVRKQPDPARYQRFLTTLPTILFWYLIGLFVVAVILL